MGIKVATYTNKDNTPERQIKITFTIKGGEKGKQSIKHLVEMTENLKDQKTPEEVDTLHSQITGYCKCCVDNEFIDQAAADELMHMVALTAAYEMERVRSEVRKKHAHSQEERARTYADKNKCSFCSATRYNIKDSRKCTAKECETAYKKAYMSSLDAYRYGTEGNAEV